jgi:very-short-patch-repair endonuclease
MSARLTSPPRGAPFNATHEQHAPPPPPLAGEGREGASPHGNSIDSAPASPAWRVKPKLRARARALRQDVTKAERVIWYAVRAHRLDGASFRRQTPIGPYIVDFVSHTAKLIIEIDGGQHFEIWQEARDAKRDAYLATKGFRVLRFSNLDVLTNRDGVVSMIAAAVSAERAPSLPSPARGGGGGVCGTGGESLL